MEPGTQRDREPTGCTCLPTLLALRGNVVKLMPLSGLPAPHVLVSPQRPVLALLCLLSLAVPALPCCACLPCHSPCLLPKPALTYMVSTGGWLCRSLGKACPRQPSGPNLGSLWKARHIPPGRPTPSARKGIERCMKPPSILGAHTTEHPPDPARSLGTRSAGSGWASGPT